MYNNYSFIKLFDYSPFGINVCWYHLSNEEFGGFFLITLETKL